MIHHSELRQELEENEIVLQVFSVEDLEIEWHHRKRRDGSNQKFDTRFNDIKDYAAGMVSPARDTRTAIRICKDLGLNGKYIIKTVDSKQYVIFKGYPGLRNIFTSPRYLANNPKVVKMAIGEAGIKNSVRIGGTITIVLFAGMNLLKFVLDQSTLAELVGTMATDLIKVGISSIVAEAVAIGVGGTAACAAGPLVVAIVVGLLVSFGLNYVDEQFGLTDKLVIIIDQYFQEFSRKKEELEKSLGRKLYELEREAVYRALRFDIANPFGRH